MEEWIQQAEVWVGQAESWIRQQPPEQIYVAAVAIAVTILVLTAGVISNLISCYPALCVFGSACHCGCKLSSGASP